MIEKKHIARQIIQDRTLGKKKWIWNVPADFRDLIRRCCYSCGNYHNVRTLVGFGKWRNKNDDGSRYICVAQGKELIYLEKSTIKEMWKWVK